MNAAKILVVFGLTLLTLAAFFAAKAEDSSSTNFILQDSVTTIEGGISTSTNFQYYSSTGQTVAGENTSQSFIQRSGFLYFPVATTPVLTAGAGDGKVNLSWSASVATLANITSYDVGISTVSGGPYTFESVGNVLAYTKTGLTNGTTYYFQLRANADTLTLAESNEASVTPVGGTQATIISPGGGAAPPVPSITTGVNFSGRAYPQSQVTILKDGQISAVTVSGPDANFSVSLSGLSAGNYVFSVYSEDNSQNRSTLFNFPVLITQGAVAAVSGIFLSPTISVDKSEVVKGENLAIFGQSVPNSQITIGISSDEEQFVSAKADKDGVYLYSLDTAPLDLGKHFTRSKAAVSSEITAFSRTVGFLVGTKTVKTKPAAEAPAKGDLNGDGRVNLLDFSIAAFWFQRTPSAQFVAQEAQDLNGDGKINLTDFSILAYYWTG
jgi:hypothetical protein